MSGGNGQNGRGRVTREQETREHTKRPERWAPPSKLPSPTSHPDYVHRWVRLSTRNEDDATNISSKLREGWEPCMARDYPEFTEALQYHFSEDARITDNIFMGGLMLCRAPEEFMRQRSDYYRQQTRDQMTAVNHNLMRENRPDLDMTISNDSKSAVRAFK